MNLVAISQATGVSISLQGPGGAALLRCAMRMPVAHSPRWCGRGGQALFALVAGPQGGQVRSLLLLGHAEAAGDRAPEPLQGDGARAVEVRGQGLLLLLGSLGRLLGWRGAVSCCEVQDALGGGAG